MFVSGNETRGTQAKAEAGFAVARAFWVQSAVKLWSHSRRVDGECTPRSLDRPSAYSHGPAKRQLTNLFRTTSRPGLPPQSVVWTRFREAGKVVDWESNWMPRSRSRNPW